MEFYFIFIYFFHFKIEELAETRFELSCILHSIDHQFLIKKT